jgi:hypothetical protein
MIIEACDRGRRASNALVGHVCDSFEVTDELTVRLRIGPLSRAASNNRRPAKSGVSSDELL